MGVWNYEGRLPIDQRKNQSAEMNVFECFHRHYVIVILETQLFKVQRHHPPKHPWRYVSYNWNIMVWDSCKLFSESTWVESKNSNNSTF